MLVGVFPIIERNINVTITSDVAVAGDNNSRIITFQIQRYFDGIDLSKKGLRIQFINSLGQSGYTLGTIADTFDAYFTFTWTVGSATLSQAGQVYFAIEFYEEENNKVVYRWQTVPATFKVEEGIVVIGDAIPINYLREIQFYNTHNNLSLTDLIDDDIPIDVVNRSVMTSNLVDVVISRDNLSQILTFRMNRMFDGIDLSERLITIKFLNADNRGDRTSAVNKKITGNILEFGWILDSKLAAKSGKIRFSIEIIGMNTDGSFYCWQTKPATFIVEEGIDVDSEIPPPEPSWLQSIYFELSKRGDGLSYEDNKLWLTAQGAHIGNPVEITGGGGIGDMRKSEYATNDKDGFVDNAISADKLSEDLTVADIVDAGTAATKDVGILPGNVVVVSENGYIEDVILPPLAIMDVHSVSNTVQMLALDAQQGDLCVVTDPAGDKLFILRQSPANVLMNWLELQLPGNIVSSVNGRVGSITLTQADVSLENVNNTADNMKNVLSATRLTTARTINGVSFDGTSNITVTDSTKAALASPAFTGTPTAPTAATTTNTTQLATTAFVKAQAYAPLASPAFTGTPTVPTASTTTSTTQAASTAFVRAQLVSPTFTGTPVAPTASTATSTTQIATTAFVKNQGYALQTDVDSLKDAIIGVEQSQLSTLDILGV